MKKPPVTLTHVQQDDHEAEERPLQLRLFKRIFSYARPHGSLVKFLLLCTITRSIQVPLLAWALSTVINGPISDGDGPKLVLAVLGYAAMAVLTIWVLFYRQRSALILGETVIHDMRADIFQHIQQMSMGFFNRTKIGRLISRMTSDSESVRMGLQQAVFISVVASGQMVIASAILCWTDWSLFAVVFATLPLYYLTYSYFRAQMSRANRAGQESFSRITATLAESVNGIKVTQGFVRQDVNARMFQELVINHSENNLAASRASGAFNASLELATQVVVVLVFMVGGYWVLAGQRGASVETLIVFYFLTHDLLGPVVSFGQQYNTAVTAMAGAERVFGLLDRKPDFEDPPHAITPPPLEGRVEFKDVHFHYDPDKPVLKGISFAALPGQTIALVGHTGSGKTTIINLIAKFYLPTQGKLLIDGLDILKLRTHDLHKQMGIVLQTNFLFTGSVLDNIRVGKPDATDLQVRQAAQALDCLDLLEALPQGLDTLVGERGAGLSLGQRQIICFCRALLANPRILILDEATSSVDTITEFRIQKALAVLLKGRTSFVVAHRLSTIRQADKILVLDHGYIVERGSHAELLATGGVYAQLYQRFVRTAESHGA